MRFGEGMVGLMCHPTRSLLSAPWCWFVAVEVAAFGDDLVEGISGFV